MNDFTIIVTIGPSILDEKKLEAIDSFGPCIYRINEAHADVNQVKEIVDHIRSILPDAKIIVDLPGNEIRTANLSEPVRHVKGETITLRKYEISCPLFYSYLKPKDIVYANDSIFRMEVKEVNGTDIKLISHSDGLLHSHRGLHVRGIHYDIPARYKITNIHAIIIL